MATNCAPGRWRMLCACAALLWACQNEAARQGTPPPSKPGAAPDVCRTGGAEIPDEEFAGFLPRLHGVFCADPNSPVRTYGAGEKTGLDGVCLQLFNGECELYKSFGLVRVASIRYVAKDGSPATVEVNVSRFSSSEGALAFFSKRVVGENDPVTLHLKPLAAGTLGAQGGGVAYVHRGAYVAEFTYVNEDETPEQLRIQSKRVMLPLAKVVGAAMPGPRSLPKSFDALPEEGRVPLAIWFTEREVLGVRGAGRAAVLGYQQAGKRFRILVSENISSDASKDVLRMLRASGGQRRLKHMPHDAFELVRAGEQGSPPVVWLVGRAGRRVAAVGDEPHALSARSSSADVRKVSLSRSQKVKYLSQVLSSGI